VTLSPRLRKLALTAHLVTAVGWIGAVGSFLALAVVGFIHQDAQVVRGAYLVMEPAAWWVLVPFAIASLITGIVIALGTTWGLFRHYWVLISFVLTVFSTAVLLLHMPTVGSMADVAQEAEGASLEALGGDLLHPGIGLVLLIVIQTLNVYKPSGLTRYGWRKQREQRARSHS
jgi:hypothetical protein